MSVDGDAMSVDGDAMIVDDDAMSVDDDPRAVIGVVPIDNLSTLPCARVNARRRLRVHQLEMLTHINIPHDSRLDGLNVMNGENEHKKKIIIICY